MDDLISRRAALDALNELMIYRPLDSDRYVISDCLNKIVGLPSTQPVRHGVWMEENRRPRSAMFYCSECHRIAYDIQPTRDKTWEKRCRYAYCPNCGARMDGEQNE